MKTIARSTQRLPPKRTARKPKPAPRRKPKSANNGRAPGEWIPPYDSANPRDGIPDLLAAPPTTEIVVHALFTAQHVIGELRYHFEMNNLTHGDMEMLAQLGKEVAAELDKEH